MDTHAHETRRADHNASAPARLLRPSLGTLFSDLWRGTTTLAREEAQLAKNEMLEKAAQAVSSVGTIAAGGAVVFAGFLALMLAAINALMPMLPPDMSQWLSPLIVGAVVMLVGFVALSGARSQLKARNLMPTRTLHSLQRDGQVLKEHVNDRSS